MSSFWAGKSIVVTGGAGFIGSHLVENLLNIRKVPQDKIRIPRSADLDLRQLEQAREAVRGADIVFHLAADVGGLPYSKANPGKQYYNNSLLDLQVAEACRLEGVSKVILSGSTTGYPKDARSPLREEELMGERPQDSHMGYGWAKRSSVILAETYHHQYGMDIGTAICNNSFGPRDNFDPETCHVIPATIRKCHELKELKVWGDGTAIRDFLYVEDMAEGFALCGETLPPGESVNLGSGKETSIRQLVETIAIQSGFFGDILFDESKPTGDPKRTTKINKAKKLVGFRPAIPLEEGLQKTIAWYRENIQEKKS